MATSTIDPSELEQQPMQEAVAMEQTQAPETAGAVTIEHLRDEVQATLSRAETTRDRINSIELSTGDSPRLQELKKQSEEVFKKIEQLVFAMMDTDRTIAEQERLQALTASAQADLTAMEKPLQQATARAMEKKNIAKKRPAEPIAPVEPAAAPEPQPAAPEPVPTATVEEPEPVIKEPVIIETPPLKETTNTVDRDAFWRELKTSLAERPDSSELFREAQSKLQNEILPQLTAIENRLKKNELREETPQNLIAIITDLQTQLGGSAYANEVQEMLTRWTTDPNEKRLFGHTLAKNFYSKITSKTGTDGLIRDIRLAKEKTATHSGIKKMKDVLSSLFQYNEVDLLEQQQIQLTTKIQVTLDTLVARMEDENQQSILLERKKQMMQAEETIARQVDFDTELRDTIRDLTTLDTKAQLAYQEWKTFALHLKPEARRLLADSMPHEIPSEAADHMDPRERNTYYSMATNYNTALLAFNQELDSAQQLFIGGVRGYTRARISKAIEGAQFNVESDYSAPPEETQPFQTTEIAHDERQLDAYIGPEEEPMDPEFVRAQAVAIADWDRNTSKSLATLIKEARRDITFSDDESIAADQIAEFLLVQMPDSAKKPLFSIAKLRRNLETAETLEEIEDILEQKQKLLDQLEPIIRNEDLRSPELIGKLVEHYKSTPIDKLKRGDTTKDDRGIKTLSPEDAEIAEVNAKTDTKAPNYQTGSETIAPSYANKQSGFDTIAAEYAKPQEAEDKNEAFWNEALALSNLFHDKMRNMTHSELLAHEKTWDHLRKLDSMIVSGKNVSELTEEDKYELVKAILKLDFDLRASNGPENYIYHNGENALKIQNVLDVLDVSADAVTWLSSDMQPAPDVEASIAAGIKKADEDRAQREAEEQAEVIPTTPIKPATARMPKKPLGPVEALAAAQRKPRKTPPRSVQSTRRPPAVAA